MDEGQVREKLYSAVAALAGVCDGAVTQDGVGFNKADTYNGRALAMIDPQDWPVGQDWAIWNMLSTYKHQLAEVHGIDFDEIPEPAVKRGDRPNVLKRLIWVQQGAWVVEYPYSDAYRFNDIMRVNGGTFNRTVDPKRWEFVDTLAVREMVQELEYVGFYLCGSAVAQLTAPLAPPPQREKGSTPEGTVDFDGSKLYLTFDKSNNLLRGAVKEIAGRRFDWDTYKWEVPVRQHTAVAALLEQFNLTLTPSAEQLFSSPPEVKPANRIELDGDVIRVYFDYDTDVLARVRLIPGRAFKDEDAARRETNDPQKHWSVPLSQAAEVLRLCHDFDIFSCSEQVLGLATHQTEKKAANLAGSRSTSADVEVDGLRGTLFPFQAAGVRYTLANKRVLLADEQGLGKTVQALATIQGARAYPAVVVCPAHLKDNWRKEAVAWLPDGVRVRVLNGRKATPLRDGDLYIVNYDVLAGWVERLVSLNPKAVVFDESHYLKNHKAGRSKAAAALAKGVEVRLALTGTPVVNRPQELINQLQVIDRLNDIGGFWHVARRYCGYSRYNGFGTPQHLDELNLKLREQCFIRRVKAEVLPELPPKTYSTISVPISNRSEYSSAEKDVIDYLRETKGAGASASAMAAEAIVRLNTLRRIVGEGKVKAAVEWIEDFLESGEKLIVFAHHIAVTNAIAEHFGAPKVTGGVSAKAKSEAVEAFQNNPDTRIIVGNLQAMGTGLTLTAASHVLIVEYAWTPAELEQAEDRAHRIGQHDNVTCYYLSAGATIDQHFESLLKQKRAVVKASTDGDKVKEVSLIKELIDMLLSGGDSTNDEPGDENG